MAWKIAVAAMSIRLAISSRTTVCDLAHEELAEAAAVNWSVPDPVPAGDPASFDAALAQLADRVGRLAPRLAAVS